MKDFRHSTMGRPVRQGKPALADMTLDKAEKLTTYGTMRYQGWDSQVHRFLINELWGDHQAFRLDCIARLKARGGND